MLGRRNICLELSPRVKEWLDGFIENSDLDDPIPGIIYGRWDDEAESHWTIGLYERADLPKIDMWLCNGDGWEFLFEDCDNIEVIENKTASFVEGRLVFE
nr:hypothetical protein [uncultured bacterium]